MIELGLINFLKGQICTKDSDKTYSEDELNDPNFLAKHYPNVGIWFIDQQKIEECAKYRWNTSFLPTFTLSEWDCFSIYGKISNQQLVRDYNDIIHFIPTLQEIDNTKRVDKRNFWQFKLPDFDCDMSFIKCDLSKNKNLNIEVNILDFFLWLIQKQLTIPKGKAVEKKMSLKELIKASDNVAAVEGAYPLSELIKERQFEVDLSLYVKREQVEGFFKKSQTAAINNSVWKGDYIPASWLRIMLFENLKEFQLNYEFDVLAFEESQPTKSILPENFDISWLFCPSAHYALYRYFEFLTRSAKIEYARLQLLSLLMGLFVFHKLKQLDKSYLLSAEYTLLRWDIKKAPTNNVGAKHKYGA